MTPNLKCELCHVIVNPDDYQLHMENHRADIVQQEREELNQQSIDIEENENKKGIVI